MPTHLVLEPLGLAISGCAAADIESAHALHAQRLLGCLLDQAKDPVKGSVDDLARLASCRQLSSDLLHLQMPHPL